MTASFLYAATRTPFGRFGGALAEVRPEGSGVVLHTENGMLNTGPAAVGNEIDQDLTNAGKIAVTELPGASYFHHADSFATMRGGHLDVPLRRAEDAGDDTGDDTRGS